MIQIRKRGQFGNNMFQYALGRIIAEELDLYLDEYKGEFAEFKPFKNILKPYNGRKGTKQGEYLTGQVIDLDSILKNKENRIITLYGFFQNWRYYLPYLNKIKHWFYLPESEHKVNDKDVLVHIRRGDFIHGDLILDPAFASSILDSIEFNNVYICGIGIHDKKVNDALGKYNPIYFEGNFLEDFKFIKQFSTVIHSASTFCWWACFLSENLKNTYLPRPTHGPWSVVHTDIDLELKNDKYHYIDNVKIGKEFNNN